MATRDQNQRIRNRMIDHSRANNDPQFARDVQDKCDDCGKKLPRRPGMKPRLYHDYTLWGDTGTRVTLCRECGAPGDFEPLA